MIPLFYNRSFIKYQNTIRELRRKQSVRNKQNRPLRRCQRLHDIPVDFPFRQRVQRARRFIQNYERIPVRNNPRQHQLLAFPTGQHQSVIRKFPGNRLIQVSDFFAYFQLVYRILNFFLRQFFPSPDIIPDRHRKQMKILMDYPEKLCQICFCILTDLGSV